MLYKQFDMFLLLSLDFLAGDCKVFPRVVLSVVLTILIGKTEPKQNKPSLLSKFIVSLIRDLKEKMWKQWKPDFQEMLELLVSESFSLWFALRQEKK